MKSKLSDGLTLLELVVAVAIIGVLMALFFPGYQHRLHLDRAALAKAYLLQVSSQQQNYLFHHGAYAHHLSQLGTAPSKALASYYEVLLEIDVSADTNNFVLKARPKLSDHDGKFRTLTLNHLGKTSDNW